MRMFPQKAFVTRCLPVLLITTHTSLLLVVISTGNRVNASSKIFGYLWVAFGNLRKCSKELRVSKPCSESSRRFCTKQSTSSISHQDVFVSSGFFLLMNPFQQLVLCMETILAENWRKPGKGHLIVCLILCVLGSETYQEAIRDIKLLFPEGVCCPPSIDLKAEEVHFTLTYSV